MDQLLLGIMGYNLRTNGKFIMKVTIEIHGADGGQDADLFVKDLTQAYSKMFQRLG